MARIYAEPVTGHKRLDTRNCRKTPALCVFLCFEKFHCKAKSSNISSANE